MIFWAIKAGWGYIVEVYNADNVLLERYEGGDCWTSPKAFGTGQIPEDKLRELALFMCELVSIQYNISTKPKYNKDLLKW